MTKKFLLILILILALFGLDKLHPKSSVSAPPNQIEQPLPPKAAGEYIPVLMYHHVGDLPAKPTALDRDLTVSSADFTVEMDYIKKAGFHSISIDQLYNHLVNHAALPDKPFVVTFDDGYADVFQNAVPILEQENMTGSFGIITGFVGTRNYADWPAIAKAQAEGMEIVSHSFSHIDFGNKKYTYAYEEDNIVKSQQDIKTHLGFDTKYFIYPYGHFDSDTQAILKAHGFVAAFTVAYGVVGTNSNLLELPRIRVHGQETLDHFIQFLGVK